MADETVSATTIINAPADAIFAVLAGERLTAAGQVFRMNMHHPNHPDGNYQMANRIQVCDPPRAISWQPGRDTGDGSLEFGGWVWRYDLAPAGTSGTKVTLSYDWSAVGDTPASTSSSPRFPLTTWTTPWPTSPAWSPRERWLACANTRRGPRRPGPGLPQRSHGSLPSLYHAGIWPFTF